jgi:hypothetical protein
MNAIAEHFGCSETAYDMFPGPYGADDLLLVIKHGLRYGELQGAGAIAWNDMEQVPYWHW